jgi:hypothetical protein
LPFSFRGTRLNELKLIIKAKELGMVFQNPENQIAMDNVMDWSLCFTADGLLHMQYATYFSFGYSAAAKSRLL